MKIFNARHLLALMPLIILSAALIGCARDRQAACQGGACPPAAASGYTPTPSYSASQSYAPAAQPAGSVQEFTPAPTYSTPAYSPPVQNYSTPQYSPSNTTGGSGTRNSGGSGTRNGF